MVPVLNDGILPLNKSKVSTPSQDVIDHQPRKDSLSGSMNYKREFWDRRIPIPLNDKDCTCTHKELLAMFLMFVFVILLGACLIAISFLTGHDLPPFWGK
ncbi:hypothetical protein TKK_0009656 [Trichogramma kaykai]